MAAPPTTPASNMNFNFVEGNYIRVSWTVGNGQRRIVIARALSPVSALPADGVTYTGNGTFGSGTEIAPGEFVVYNGTSIFADVYNLQAGTTYYFAVFEFNTGTGTNEYLTSAFLSGNRQTVAAPTIATSNVTFSSITGNSIKINWTNGNGQRRLALLKDAGPVSSAPSNFVPYTANSIFGFGSQIGTGNYVVFLGNTNTVTVSNLLPGHQYHVAIYEVNGLSAPVFITTAATGSVTTAYEPTVPASAASVVQQDGNQFRVSWTPGNGTRRLVIAKKGSAVTAAPVDGTTYTASTDFGVGQEIAGGEFVVYDGTSNLFMLQNLEKATTYYLKVFEYDGTGATSDYLLTSPATTSGSTVSAPTVQVSNLQVTPVSATSVSLSWNNGNGAGRLVIARKASPVSVVPVDLTDYTYNSNYGSGTITEPDAYVIYRATGAGVTVTNLQAGQTYHFAAFEFNGSIAPVYQVSAPATATYTTGTLPVRLVAFTANRVREQIQLKWQTASESGASYFDVQAGTDGMSFTTIGTIAAAGNSNETVLYTYEDKPNSGKEKIYYRLKIVDQDGSFTFSATVMVQLSGASQPSRVVSNPVVGSILRISLGNEFQSGGQLLLTDNSGRRISVATFDPAQGIIDIPVQQLTPGVYYVKLSDGRTQRVLPFVKK